MEQQHRSSSLVGIKATYYIVNHEDTDLDHGAHPPASSPLPVAVTTKEFNRSNTTEARMGLPIGCQPVKPQPGDDSYSGMHDQGPLPDLKEGGPMALLLGCNQAAKEFNNEFLTQLIQKKKKHDAASSIEVSKSSKKNKMHDV